MDFLEEIESKIIPGDGAMGTLLLDAGVRMEKCFEELCVSAPEMIAKIHDDYIAAGARVVRTNTFGANAVRLARFGFENRVNEINWSAAQLARQCARGKNVFVAGSVGPLGISADEAKARGIDRQSVFQEQLGALLDGGVHLIFFETFTDFDELALALYVKQSLHHCPAVCSMACQPGGRLPSGFPVDEAFQKLRALGAEIVGVNCVEPRDAVELFEKISVNGAMSAFPNAGNKTRATPEEFAQITRDLAHTGVKLIGGCCGTTPAHIAAMTHALAEAR